MAVIMDGKELSKKLKASLKTKVDALKSEGIFPCLAVIIVGKNPASEIYVNNKKKSCAELGIKSLEYALPEKTTEEELLSLIEKLNVDGEVDGILCQLPLPEHICEKNVINAISPEKDVDAFHPTNVGHIMIGDYAFLPCTPAGVMEFLEEYKIDVSGKNCVVLGRSNIVGKPMTMLLVKANATVTVCHSKTSDISEFTKKADLIVSAVGKPKLITADMVKEGAVIIDVAINRLENGKICGDVDFENVKDKASYITPVPGGVGPMTIATLMKNTVTAATNNKRSKKV